MIAALSTIKYAYFIGIGGIGMSALARWFSANGRQVAGYDRSPSALTAALEKEGIAVHYEDDLKLVHENFCTHKENVLVVYTPAVPKNHSELLYFQAQGYTIKKRAEVLGIIAANMRCIAVAGTHGKTTTSSMIAHILTDSGVDCAAFLGGITQNYQTNLLLNKELNENTFVVVEADEFDRSFLQLHPEIAVITSTDADHLDIYGSAAEVQNSYTTFAEQVGKQLFVSLQTKLNTSKNIAAKINAYANLPFASNEGIFATHIRIENAKFVFNYVSNAVSIENISLQTAGFHNVENAVAAISVALHIGIGAERIKKALATFGGVKRRFEYIAQNEKMVLIDDYAHHPTEIEAFLKSAKALYPTRKLTAIFQPHLFSRTQDFYKEFAAALSLADTLVLLPIYPARELQADFPTISSQIILDLVTIADKQIVPDEDVVDFLSKTNHEIMATIGAGSVENLILPIKNAKFQVL